MAKASSPARTPTPRAEGAATQIDRFKELARELGCDEDEGKFDAALKKVARAPPPPKHEPKKHQIGS